MEFLFYTIGSFIFLLVLLVLVRIKTGNKFEIKNTDIVLALIPIGLWLFLSGKVQELTFGDFKLVAAVKEASKSSIKNQMSEIKVQSIAVERVSSAAKGSVNRIDDIIKDKNEAITFIIGKPIYTGFAIRKYITELIKYPYLAHLIINNTDGTFYGIADAKQFALQLLITEKNYQESDENNYQGQMQQSQSSNSDISNNSVDKSKQLADALNSSGYEFINSLPGFIGIEKALTADVDRNKTLQTMSTYDLFMLPIIDENKKFIGIVDRSKLTASMLIDINKKLEEK